MDRQGTGFAFSFFQAKDQKQTTHPPHLSQRTDFLWWKDGQPLSVERKGKRLEVKDQEKFTASNPLSCHLWLFSFSQ